MAEVEQHQTIRMYLLAGLGPAEVYLGPSEDDQLAEAVYELLRGDPELGLAVDGWLMFRVMEEDATTLRVVGVMSILPDDDAPLELELKWEAGAVFYTLHLGIVDEEWKSQSESKRWRSIYQYSKGEAGAGWTWAEPWQGRAPAR